MSVSYNGYKNYTLTVEKDNVSAGYPATLNAEGKLVNTQNGKEFIGICTAVRGDYASVQTDGYIEIKYSGSAPEYGMQYFVSAGSGSVKTADNTVAKRAACVVMVDTTNNVVGFIL